MKEENRLVGNKVGSDAR